MIEIPFIPGMLILLAIFIVIIRVYMTIANEIGELIRMFFIGLWKMIKK
jgi:hypothetical protein